MGITNEVEKYYDEPKKKSRFMFYFFIIFIIIIFLLIYFAFYSESGFKGITGNAIKNITTNP